MFKVGEEVLYIYGGNKYPARVVATDVSRPINEKDGIAYLAQRPEGHEFVGICQADGTINKEVVIIKKPRVAKATLYAALYNNGRIGRVFHDKRSVPVPRSNRHPDYYNFVKVIEINVEEEY